MRSATHIKAPDINPGNRVFCFKYNRNKLLLKSLIILNYEYIKLLIF